MNNSVRARMCGILGVPSVQFSHSLYGLWICHDCAVLDNWLVAIFSPKHLGSLTPQSEFSSPCLMGGAGSFGEMMSSHGASR